MTDAAPDNTINIEKDPPTVLLLYTDLMFGVQLQNMARKAGYRVSSFRPGTPLPGGDVLIVDLSARADWEEAIRQAREQGMPVMAFGPRLGRKLIPVAGMIFTRLGRVPKAGTVISMNGYRFEVDRADKRRIYRVKISPDPEWQQGEEAS